MFLFFIYILQLLFFVLVFVFFDTTNSEGVSITFVLINATIVTCLLTLKLRPFISIKMLEIVLLGFFIRLGVLFLDVYKVIPILHSGGDSEGFHLVASENVIRSGMNLDWATYTNYSDILSFIYIYCNSQRLVAQYLNVLFGMGVIYYLWLTCRELKLNNKTIGGVVTILCFFPTAIIFSGILLREAWQQFFLMYSLYYFTKWFKLGKFAYILIAVISVLAAAYMHSGSLFLLLGYLVAYMFYNPKMNYLDVNFKNVLKSFIVIVLFLIFFFAGSTFTNRFNAMQEMEEEAFLESLKVTSTGGSRYLTWIDITSNWQLIAFSPLKMFYFLFSPIPFDWRGLNDIIAFLFDSMFYLFWGYTILKYYKQVNKRLRRLLGFIAISFCITVFVFAYGTITAGTAMRHRCKMIGIVLVAYAVVQDSRKSIMFKNES